MHTSGIQYRVQQFWDALTRKPLTQSDLAPVRSVLTDQQMALFSRLQPSEQSHGLRVLKFLQAQGETHPDLLTAALLHDVGKSRHPLRLYERVVIVLAKKFFPDQVKTWGCGLPTGWRRPFVIAEQHPSWGAADAKNVGASPLAVHLIRAHQSEIQDDQNIVENRLLSLLKEADSKN
jgi:hypothetical protein